MHRFRYGGLNTPGIYVDEDVKHLANTHQAVIGVLIDTLLEQGDIQRALAVCQKWQQEMPQANVPYTETALSMARCYYLAHQPEQADDIVATLLRRAGEWLSWIETIVPSRRKGSDLSRYIWLKTMQQALAVAEQFDRTTIFKQYID
jgi:ATP/maltotriose-dependent transcriptional regulator MalT